MNNVPADREHVPKTSTVGAAAGMNYTGHFTEVLHERFNLEGRF